MSATSSSVICPLCHAKWSEAGTQKQRCPTCGATEGEMFRAALVIIRRLQQAARPAPAAPVQPKQPTQAEIRGEQEFNRMWAERLYPRTKGVSRVAALKSWMARIREGVSPEAMIEGTKAYAAYVKAQGTEQQFIKQPETFYGPARHFESDWGQERREGEPGAAKPRGRGPFSPEDRARDELERFYAQEVVL